MVTRAIRDATTLEAWFPHVALGKESSPEELPPVTASALDEERRVARELVTLTIDLDAAPADVADAYLRLHLLSLQLVAPHGLNLDGIFGLLPTVARTQIGSVHVDDVLDLMLKRRLAGQPLSIDSVDKFPRLTDFVLPPAVRIADAARVRLGAHLAPGTVVMHEGFVNFNAGSLGKSMIEGRITQGTVVEAGADIGAGSSTMGTLSGGGEHRVRIGEGSLLGANAGVGISLGRDCAVEAGLYVTRGTIVSLPDGSHVKAQELSGQDYLLFRRNSRTGLVEALPWKSKSFVALNAALH